MNGQGVFDFGPNEGDSAALLSDLLTRAERVLVKKLSNNDRDWARLANKHQAGVYIPAEQRDGGFFPALEVKPRREADAAEIREAWFGALWPQTSGGRRLRRTRIVHYTSKGPETHLTGVPRECFDRLLPASFLVIGRYRRDGATLWECLTIDSASDEAEMLRNRLDIAPDFLIGEFDPAALRVREQDRVLVFAEELIMAWKSGGIASFSRSHAALPTTTELATRARALYIKRHGYARLDPFVMARPGDALRDISRSIEWEMFRDFQRQERAVALIRILLGDEPREMTTSQIIRQLICELPGIDALMLSASQQRKSRAGYSYEHHIEAMLVAGGIPFEKQVTIEAGKRPDFVLPGLAFLRSGRPEAASGLILSAKTTLRERWKQVEREKAGRNLYLTTVDENIAANVIEDMASFGAHLVIPESLMDTRVTEYAGHANVLTFHRFCHEIIRPAMQAWI